jgi:hypothetical protein
MPRGRPKGSTGIYIRWKPKRIASLWEDADILADKEGKVDKRRVAALLKEAHPKKYRDTTVEQLRQQLSKKYQSKKSLGDRDDFNADAWAYLLGEKK